MDIAKQTISHNLNRFRHELKYSQRKVAEMSGLSFAAYQRIEKGESVPRINTLYNIASALKINILDIMAQPQTLSQVRFRSTNQLRIRGNILIEVAGWLHQFNYLEELLHDKVNYAFVELSHLLQEKNNVCPLERAKEAAALARQQIDLTSDEPILDICGLLEASGIKILRLPKTAKGFFGLSVGVADGGPAVVVNTCSRIPVERWIFSAAHEFGHLLLHLKSFNPEECLEDSGQEAEADVFASHFLMPSEGFSKYFRQCRGLNLVDMVFKIKRIYGVSYKTVLKRLLDDRLVGKDIWLKFQLSYKARYGNTIKSKEEPHGVESTQFNKNSNDSDPYDKEPNSLDQSDFIEDRLRGLVRRAIEEEKITVSKGAEILKIDIASMKNELAIWNSEISQIAL